MGRAFTVQNPRKTWPQEVPVLRADDFIVGHWRKKNCKTRHCAEGWLALVFGGTEGTSTVQSPVVRKARGLWARELGLIHNPERLMGTNDSAMGLALKHRPHNARLRWLANSWNRAMTKLGYVADA